MRKLTVPRNLCSPNNELTWRILRNNYSFVFCWNSQVVGIVFRSFAGDANNSAMSIAHRLWEINAAKHAATANEVSLVQTKLFPGLIKKSYDFLAKFIAALCDWRKNLAPLSPPIRSKTKTHRNLLIRVFPRLAAATCICFEFWLVH